MQSYSKSKILFSQHIPKTAGTSFTDVLRKWFWPGFHAHYFDHQHGRMPLRPRKIKWLLHYTRLYPMCIHGHFEEEAGVYECYPRASQFITVVRDPLELQLSLFFDHKRRLKEEGGLYWKGKEVQMEFDGDIDQWVEERPSFLLKFFPWAITLDNYQEVINKHFVHIGVTEELQQSINIFAEKLEKKTIEVPHKNISPRTERPSESAIRKFREKHPLEYALYEYCLRLNR